MSKAAQFFLKSYHRLLQFRAFSNELNSSHNQLKNMQESSKNIGQTRLIQENVLERQLADEENNQEILEKFVESLKVTEHESPLPPLTPTEIQNARRSKLESGTPVYRKIVYDEGELDGSRLDEPPSRENPHPFDAAMLPPVYSHTMLPFVNHSPVLRLLVDIGVDLAEIENTTTIGRYLMRLQMDDVRQRVELMQKIGFEDNGIGAYLTRNPYFLLQDVNDIETRLNYLEMKKFKKEEILKIVDGYRYWLNCNVKLIDSRLGWIQKNFKLTAKATREIIVKEPRVIMFGMGPIERILKMLQRELGFSEQQCKRLIVDDPRLFMMDSKIIFKTYKYVRDVMGINNETIVENALLLRCALSCIKSRHDFLKKTGRARYKLTGEDGGEDLVTMEQFLDPSDAQFAIKAAKSYPVAFDKFLRNC